MNNLIINELFQALKERKNYPQKESYTSFLLNNSELLAKKIGEETSELIIDYVKINKEGVLKESADIIYHLLVIWISIGIKPEDVWNELSKRKSISGFEEKKSRGKSNE